MRRRLAVPLALAVAGLLAPAAQAAPPNPFGHACAPQDGVLFCPTAIDAERVPSWDGVPLDVDVTLPASGDGPFPTIVMMHGYGGNKTAFEATRRRRGYNNVFFAQQGYAVVNYSARGFGRSCGTPDSRTSPGCDRGWLHLADHRYEARDTQHLLGLLVDQGVARADALGVTGVSYGGIQTLNLARLRDRIRLPDGSFQPWTSPNGTPLKIAAAYARWPGSDLTYALQPNGRFLDFRTPKPSQSITPGGVMKKSYNDGLYFSGNATGFYAPHGRRLQLRHHHLEGARRPRRARARGRPRRGQGADRLPQLGGPHRAERGAARAERLDGRPLPGPRGAARLPHVPAPRPARGSRSSSADLGHPRGTNNPGQNGAMQRQAADFFAAYLKGQGQAPAHGSVLAYTQTCPAYRAGRGPLQGRELGAAAPEDGDHAPPRAAADELAWRQPGHGAGDRPDRRRGQGVQQPSRRSARRARRDPAPLHEAIHDARAADRAGSDPYEGPRRPHRRAALGRASRRADAGLARRLPAEGQPARRIALPAVRQRLALRARAHREARAARQRPGIPPHEQLQVPVTFSRTRVDLPGR